jgi:glycosyltransferase involved in cell wall biosynthesis
VRVWLVTVGEPLPTDPGSNRLLRAGILAQLLATQGHEVVWWTSTFDHFQRRLRSEADETVRVAANYTIQMLHGGGYRRNISLQRIRDHQELARRFAERAPRELRPDVVLCSLPPLELAATCTSFGKARGVPVVLDVRDLWPDIFADMLPRGLRWMARPFVAPMERFANRACRDATAIFGNGPALLEWGLRRAGRRGAAWDRAFPHGYVVDSPDATTVAAAERFWMERGVVADSNGLTVVFIGTIGRQFDFDSVLDAAQRLRDRDGIRFVICGAGESLPRLQRRSRELSRVTVAGWCDRAEIWALLRMASIGLAPYVEREDFRGTVPNKIPEYLSAGVPVAVSLRSGYLRDFITEHGIGFAYDGSGATLADSLEALHRSPERLRRMRVQASAAFEREFRADVVYQDMANTLQNIAAAGAVPVAPPATFDE